MTKKRASQAQPAKDEQASPVKNEKPADKFERHRSGAVSMTAEQAALTDPYDAEGKPRDLPRPKPFARHKDAIHVIDPSQPCS